MAKIHLLIQTNQKMKRIGNKRPRNCNHKVAMFKCYTNKTLALAVR